MPTEAQAAVAPMTQQFAALSDDTRLRILDLLSGGERCVCELTAALDVPQPLLSFHLKTLREAELVTHRRQGRWVYYAPNVRALRELAHFVGQVSSPRQAARAC